MASLSSGEIIFSIWYISSAAVVCLLCGGRVVCSTSASITSASFSAYGWEIHENVRMRNEDVRERVYDKRKAAYDWLQHFVHFLCALHIWARERADVMRQLLTLLQPERRGDDEKRAVEWGEREKRERQTVSFYCRTSLPTALASVYRCCHCNGNKVRECKPSDHVREEEEEEVEKVKDCELCFVIWR